MNKKILNATYLIAVILLVAQFLMSSWRATDGDKLADMDSQITELEIANNRLKDQIYQATSLENIAAFSAGNNMSPAKITNLSSITVALNRQ